MRKKNRVLALLTMATLGCLKAQPDIENPTLAAPEIQIDLVDEFLDTLRRTTNPSPKIQVDVHGAELGVELRFFGPNAQSYFLPCTVLKTKPYQRWECTPTAGVEGDYRLEVEARSRHENTSGHFSWYYEKRVFLLENKEAWGRDDALYVQLEDSKGVNWSKAELFVGEGQQHRATRTVCPSSLPAKLHAECFKVSLSELPNLPHGKYALRLTAKLVDKAGDLKSHTRGFDIHINRRLWSLALSPSRFSWSAVTREGWLLLLIRDSGTPSYPKYRGGGDRLVAINAEGEEVWSTKLPGFRRGLLLGNHRGLDVVIANCHNEKEEEEKKKGFHAVHAKTGEVLFSNCTDSEVTNTVLTLLQGGPDRDLVVLRESYAYCGQALEVCRFGRPHASSPWRFRCDEPKEKCGGSLLVRQTPEGVRAFKGSSRQHWCALEWKNKKGWSPGCVAQGPRVANFGLSSAYIWRLGSEHLWAAYSGTDGNKRHEWVQSFNLNTGLETVWDVPFQTAWTPFPVLVDAQDELIIQQIQTIWTPKDTEGAGGTKGTEATQDTEAVKSTETTKGTEKTEGAEDIEEEEEEEDAEEEEEEAEGTSTVNPLFQRYMPNGTLLSQRKMWVTTTSIALMEGGNFLLPGKDFGLACLKPDFSDCWEGAAEADGDGDFLGVLPLSPTRSIVVLGYEENRVSAFLVDTPGLKKDAPWPIYGHDLCRSNNLSVPVDNCWEGPKL